ncbi:MAG: DUF3082 domain-containing protein [Cyanobacteriota bacterium]|nr:DUF3082 domain-containing protein [Cyanobacteriota bacterium]
MSAPPEAELKPAVTPLRCLTGSVLSGAFAWGLYRLTAAIAVSFATKPLLSSSLIAQRISAAVRTLVLGVAALGTFIFAFVALGLVLLALQLLFQSLISSKEPTP